MSKQDIETVLFDLINKYELQRTSVPITAKEFIEKPTQALTHLINKAKKEARIDELDNQLPSLLNYSLNQEQLNLIHDRIKELRGEE